MKPEENSWHLLSVTQSKAKMYEYNVPLEDHIKLQSDPADLFILTIGLLGDVAARINDEDTTEGDIQELRASLPFSARFFDAYVETRLTQQFDPYIRLLDSAAYYLCDVPGSSSILAKRISNIDLDVGAFGLENLLAWLLSVEGFPTVLPDPPDSPYRDLISAISALFLTFYASGSQIDETLEATLQLRTMAYELGSPRHLLLADLIGAVVRLKLQNSTWNCLPKYSGLSPADWANVIQKANFIKEFWPAQHLLGERGVFRGASAVVQMPTSAGKTKATEIIIRSAFLANRTSLAVIIAPFRALCHEIRQSLLRAFQGEAIYVDELSDVLQMDLSVETILDDQQVLIATPEKFNYVLRHEPELAQKIGLIIYDEGHQFDNGTRGITYELLLTSLKARMPKTAQTILISAVISNASQIGQWLIGDNAETVDGLRLAPTFRSIGFASTDNSGRNLHFVNRDNPDEEEFWVPRIFSEPYILRHNVLFPHYTDGKEIALFLGLRLINHGSVAIFSGIKDSVGTMCDIAVKVYRNGLPLPQPLEASDRVEVQRLKYLHDTNLGEDASASRSANLGIFAHHNNIPHGIRLAVEYAMKEGLAKFVICTSTLAQGVNLPIRYLIVTTSIYQGQDKITVRDFQNLIGRSGRSGMHTEGSILFADPTIYDERRHWSEVKELLDPSKSEKCDSKLFSLFDPLYSDDQQFSIGFELSDLVEKYMLGKDAIASWGNDLALSYAEYGFTASGLQRQIDQKINIISAVESYLMANWDPVQPTFENESLITLAKGALAYFLANDDQKKQIEDLFIFLALNIEVTIPEVSRRIILGKTMYGVPDSLAISNWLDEHGAELTPDKAELDLFNVLWPLIADNIHNKRFNNCTSRDAMKNLAISWLDGIPFRTLFQTLTDSGAKLIAGTQRRNYKIEHIVDICENGFAYDGALVLGALIELVQSMSIEDAESVKNTLQYLQKRLKYGLPNQVAVMLYEMGFADRVVALDLSSLFLNFLPDKKQLIRSLRDRREEIFTKLDLYPSYFSEVYRNQVIAH